MRYIGSEFLGHATAADLLTHFKDGIRELDLKEQIEDKTTSLLVQIDNRIRILVMLQIMMLNISSPVYVITKISAIISRYLTAKFEQ